MDKILVFKNELGWIQDSNIKAFGEKLITCAPGYFWEVSSSSTNKYHPAYAVGAGGLVRHTKAAAKILHELLQLEMFNKYTQDKKDMMLVAIIAHDFFKHGLEDKAGRYTVAEHPLVCAEYIKGNAELCSMLNEEQIDFICGCIASHMGQWSTDYKSKKEILPKPATGPQNMVHLADYLASRKYLIMDFGDDNYELDKPVPENQEAETKDGALAGMIAEINAICKEKIENGVDRKSLYAIIAEVNGGNRNPNSIQTVEIAMALKERLTNG